MRENKNGGKKVKKYQLFPFERNRYYAGKMLTSADFEAEQLYMNNKRQFLNRVLFGSGVVCGLNVVNLDDVSILLESGVALDGNGREIVVDETVIKRLSGIEGFENLKGERARLCIRYKEETVHDVYCGDIGTGTKEYESNRIDERYELYLKDAAQTNTDYICDELFLREKIVDNADYTVFLAMPYTVPKGQAVKILLNICKNSNETKEISCHLKLQLPAFTDINGNHELEIAINNLLLAKGQVIQKEYWIYADNTEASETDIICRQEDMQFNIGKYEIEPGRGIQLKVFLSNESPYELATHEVGKANLDTEMNKNDDDGVCIAELQLIRTDVSCLIGDIKEQGIKHYIVAPRKEEERQLLLSHFADNNKTAPICIEKNLNHESNLDNVEIPTFITSGRLEIPLDVNMKKGDVCFSEEIMHGLGKGNVYVEVGVEYINDEPLGKNNGRNTIYGNPELFKLHECMNVETAVRVLNDKGSFQVAAKLLGEQKSIVLQLNWVAVKFNTMKDADEIQEEDNRSIIPETPTVRLKAKDSYYFNVKFQNMQPCRLSYELTEAGSGEIGVDGLYTAPAKEGVYEIHIYCTDMPKISTYVYAVVGK